MTRGMVSLVGAGPGDPELLTVRALRRLRAADLVLYDALVSPAIVALARRAELREAAGRCAKVRLAQDAIIAQLIEAARAGRRVVRLKGGDPVVFGRGGEEAQALAEANIPFEIVPGISAAISAPSLAGIPVTHRGVAAGFTVVNGHDPLSWPVSLARYTGATTLVVLMGIGNRPALVAALARRGWSLNTPAAIVLRASTPDAHAWAGTLGTLAAPQISPERDGPGVIVVGEVVAHAVELNPRSGTWQPSMIRARSAARA